jgi:hypothetical protein
MTDATPGQRISGWTVIKVDRATKRAHCMCRCGAVREVPIASLLSGESRSCGCSPLPAAEIMRRIEQARSERVSTAHDWRPKR